MKNWPKNRIIIMSLGILLGGLAGYLYWFYVGCNSGTCAITSKAPNSTAYGVLMGGLIASSIWDSVKKKKNANN